MPLWVTRQWHVLGLPQRAVGISRRLQWASGPVATHLRSFTQSLNHDSADIPTLRTFNSAIIIPSSVANIQPKHLIQRIEPIPTEIVHRDRFAVFFVTPAFATWLLDDQAFLHQALRQAYKHVLGSNKSRLRIHTLCAVVDKLPAPKSISTVNLLDIEARFRTVDPPVSETGYEGIAYAMLSMSESVSSTSDVNDTKGAICFLATQISDKGTYNDALRLPLANTVFHTGSPSTMIFSTWDKSKEASDITLKSKKNISHHEIRFHRGGSVKQSVTALAVPLVPLTLPRQVEGSMGNILRRVIGPDGKSVAASQELEHAVPAYFKSRGEPSQATSVWALVIPRNSLVAVTANTNHLFENIQHKDSEGDAWEALWRSDPPIWNEIVPYALSAGARLHRVLSGGGGWGKKAGLLSLDPIVSSSVSDPSPLDEPEDLSSALQQVAQEGDSIQFFISPSASKSAVQPLKQLRELTKAQTEHAWTWELGTIPSTADALPTNSWQHQPSDSIQIFAFKNSFGALAEGGMVLKRRFKFGSEDKFSLAGASTVDVPFSRFSAVALKGEERQVIEDEDIMQNFLGHSQSRDLCSDSTPSILCLPQEAPDSAQPPTSFNQETPIRRVDSSCRCLYRPTDMPLAPIYTPQHLLVNVKKSSQRRMKMKPRVRRIVSELGTERKSREKERRIETLISTRRTRDPLGKTNSEIGGSSKPTITPSKPISKTPQTVSVQDQRDGQREVSRGMFSRTTKRRTRKEVKDLMKIRRRRMEKSKGALIEKVEGWLSGGGDGRGDGVVNSERVFGSGRFGRDSREGGSKESGKK